jgi:hypothetical protein
MPATHVIGNENNTKRFNLSASVKVGIGMKKYNKNVIKMEMAENTII